MSKRLLNVWWTQSTSSSGTIGFSLGNYTGSSMDIFAYISIYGNYEEYRITSSRFNMALNSGGNASSIYLMNSEKTKIIGCFSVGNNYLSWACSSEISIKNESYEYSYSGFSNSLSNQTFTINYSDDVPVTQLNFTVPPTTEIYNINLMSDFGGVNIEASATENTYGTWPMSYGTNITLTASGKLAHLLLTPKVSTKPNVSQNVDVTVDGITTTYPLTQNPNIDLWAGKDVKVEVSSPAPTVTVDYTNTSTPVITDTPTGG